MLSCSVLTEKFMAAEGTGFASKAAALPELPIDKGTVEVAWLVRSRMSCLAMKSLLRSFEKCLQAGSLARGF